jgi:hypothetical protein
MKNRFFLKFGHQQWVRSSKSLAFKLSLSIASLSLTLLVFYNACSEQKNAPKSNGSRTVVGQSLQKTKGINVGESRDIWAANFVALGAEGDATYFNIYKLALNVEKGFPIKTWKLKTPSFMNSPSGSRTFVTEWGLLVARSATVWRPDVAEHPDNEVTLYLIPSDNTFDLVRNQSSGIRAIFTTGPRVDSDYAPLYRDESADIKGVKGAQHWGRASTLSYKVTVDGQDYKYIGVIWRLNRTTPTLRLERFLWNETQKTFIRVRPYEFTPQEDNVTMAGVGVYTGALNPCDPHLKVNDVCIPAYYGAPFGAVFGIKLNGDVPSVQYNDSQKGPVFSADSYRYLPPNVSPRFQSTSHPSAGGGGFGSINGGVYSAAVDTSSEESDQGAGSLLITNQSSLRRDECCSTHVAFDSLNDLVFSTFRESVLNQPPGAPSTTGRSIVSVFRKECFFKTADCGPDTNGSIAPKKDRFRIYEDVGASLGPISDLGNGCVAALDLNRPLEGLKQFSGVYRICINDPKDLSKGVGSLKIADLQGNAYMYNDFTAATLYDLPIISHFDFWAESQLQEVKNVKFYWEPKQAYPVEMFGLRVSYRCYANGTVVTDNLPAFQPISSENIPKAFEESTPLEACGGPEINQVDLKLERIGRQRYTRFQMIKLSSD